MQWMQTIDNISEIARIPFLEVFNLPVRSFLDLLSYLVYKNKELEKKYKK